MKFEKMRSNANNAESLELDLNNFAAKKTAMSGNHYFAFIFIYWCGLMKKI